MNCCIKRKFCFCGDFELTSETESNSNSLTDPCARRVTKQHLVYGQYQWPSLCSSTGLEKGSIPWLEITNGLFQAAHLSKGRCFTRCNFLPLGLSKSSVGLALQLICFLTSPNTEGSLRGCKNLNTPCSGKESLRKFAEANLLIIF